MKKYKIDGKEYKQDELNGLQVFSILALLGEIDVDITDITQIQLSHLFKIIKSSPATMNKLLAIFFNLEKDGEFEEIDFMRKMKASKLKVVFTDFLALNSVWLPKLSAMENWLVSLIKFVLQFLQRLNLKAEVIPQKSTQN